MKTTEATHSGTTLLMAIEMGNNKWIVKSTDAKSFRLVELEAGAVRSLEKELERAKAKFKLPATVPLCVCYEAGRDGFWLARYLTERGIQVKVVDPASIEVPQRHHRVKTDRIDVGKLLDMLKRQVIYGEQPWRECRVPSVEEEDAARLAREHHRLKKERGALANRTRSLLILHGIRVRGSIRADLDVSGVKTQNGETLGAQLRQEIERGLKRLALVDEQLKTLSAQRRSCITTPVADADHKAAKLSALKSVGEVTATALSRDFFWRKFRNRREVGAMAGLCGSPYDSGQSQVEQGISKAGNPRIRTLMIELAWLWVRFQPDSELTHWFHKRQAGGNKRGKRVLIVALARKLLVALWKYLEKGDVPKGAILKAA